MLDLNAYEQEVDLADDDVLQVVPVQRVGQWGVALMRGRALKRPAAWGHGDGTQKRGDSREVNEHTHLDLLYSNSMCRQSSIPTSILIELLLSGGIRYECTHRSFSLVTSAILLEIVTLMKYLGAG